MQNLVDVNTAPDKAALVNREFPLTIEGNVWLVDGMWRIIKPIPATKLFDFDPEMFTIRNNPHVQKRISELNRIYSHKGGRRAKQVKQEIERTNPPPIENKGKLVSDKVNLEHDEDSIL